MSDEAITGNKYAIIVDVAKINRLLSQLGDADAKKAVKAGIRKSALIIRKAAQANLVSAFPSAARPTTKKGVTFKALKNDINIAVYRDGNGARIDLLNKRKKGARAYVLRFIELGTKQRATKKSKNRGIMNAYNFFSSAVASKRSEAENSLEQNIISAINKVIDRNK